MDLRGGMLRWFSDQHVTPREIWGEFAQRGGYGVVEDYVRGCDRRFGPGASDACRARMDEHWQQLVASTPAAQGASPATMEKVRLSHAHQHLLHAMADVDFVHVVEAASELAVHRMAYDNIGMSDCNPTEVVLRYVNGVLKRRGVPYQLDHDLVCRFNGDQAVHELVIAPAVAALADTRLAGARGEFEDALVKLRRAQPKDLEDSIEESRKAVESAMKVLLIAHGGELPTRPTTSPLHGALVAAAIVEPQTDDLVRAAARMANAAASHGSGSEIRAVPADLATAAVSAAAVAITFLAGRLP